MKKKTYSMSMACAIILMMLSQFLCFCTKNDIKRETELLRETLRETESLVSVIDLSRNKVSLEIINKELFNVISKTSEMKSIKSNEVFRYELQTWFSQFPFNEVNVHDTIFQRSFFKAIKGKGVDEILAITDIFLDVIDSEKVPTSDQERLFLNISLFRDLTIFFNFGIAVDSKGRRDREYWLARCGSGYKNNWSDCWDCCMKEMWEDLGFTDYAEMTLSLFFPWMGVKMISCGEDCARTDNESY